MCTIPHTEDEECPVAHSAHIAKKEGSLHEASHTRLELEVIDAVPKHKYARRSAQHRIRQGLTTEHSVAR